MNFTKLVSGIAIASSLALGGVGLATPTQAAGLSFTFGNGVMHNGVVLRFRNGHFDNNYCLSNTEIRSQLRGKGFRDVQVIRTLGRQAVLAVGRKGTHWYQLTVNPCTGAVDQQRIRRSPNGNFSFTLNFGSSGYDGRGQPGRGDGYPDRGGDGGYGNGGMGDGQPGNGGNHGNDGQGNGGPGDGGTREKLVCYVTFFDASQVAAGADADVESARVLRQSQAQAIDKPNDRSAIFDYGTNQQTIATCNALDQQN
jgi:hypothetical protein